MDFYVILGIERGASLRDIKRAYKRLARRFHPDINPGDRTAAVQFRQIVEAYETLSDPDRRGRYDSVGYASTTEEGAATFGFEVSDLWRRPDGSADRADHDRDASGVGRRRPRPHRRQRPCGAERRGARRPLPDRPRAGTPGVPPRRRRSAPGRAHRGARSRAGRE